MAGSVADSGQHLRRPIDGNHLRFGEPCGESARTRPRSGPHVDDDTRIDPIGDPVDQSVQIASMHVGIEIQQICRGVAVPVFFMMTVMMHSPTL